MATPIRPSATRTSGTTNGVYRPHRLAEEPPVFLFYEPSRSDAAFDFHKTAPHLAGFREQMTSRVARPTEIELYRALTD